MVALSQIANIAAAVVSTQGNTVVRHVRLRIRDVRERRETFVSFVAPRPGVSRHAVTVTARNARRFVRHGVSITRVGPRTATASLYINHFGRWPSCRRPSTTYYPSFSPPRSPRSLFASAQHTYQPSTSTLFWASRTCVRCASPCC